MNDASKARLPSGGGGGSCRVRGSFEKGNTPPPPKKRDKAKEKWKFGADVRAEELFLERHLKKEKEQMSKKGEG